MTVSFSSFFEPFFHSVVLYYSKEDLKLIEKACLFADKAHEGQTRLNGDPYISHPLAVAKILADLRLDPSTLITGILHDTVEDTSISLEDIEKEFGKTVAELVNGVTKLPEITLETDAKKQADNFRKIILSMAKDIRVILVKLADRLSNMRTLQHMKPEKQIQKAQETIDIYAPLANRLGIYWLKEELEDLCLLYLHPKIHQMIQKKMDETQVERNTYMEKIHTLFEKALKEYDIQATTEGKIKHFYSIFKKIERRNNVEFEKMDDILFFQILVENITECYKCLGVIHAHYKPIPGKFKDYIAMPKVNAYQALHTSVIGPTGERIEIQIRTHEMQEICYRGITANWISPSSHTTEDSPKTIHTEWINRLLEWNKDFSDPNEFLKTLKIDLFPEDVFAFTPKGELKRLPYASSIIDFAYAVHTMLGHHCVGAKVNGKNVSLKYRIKSGDLIELLTSESATPSKDWLKFIQSSKAKAKISKWFRQEKEPTQEKSTHPSYLISSENIQKNKVRLAHCCSPLPGEPAIGLRQNNQKVVIHEQNCKNILKVEEEKKLLTSWDPQSIHEIQASARIQVHCETAQALFSVYSTLLNVLKVPIEKAELHQKTGLFEIRVFHAQELNNILASLEKIPKLIQIEKIK